jgi:hypothetical protein
MGLLGGLETELLLGTQVHTACQGCLQDHREGTNLGKPCLVPGELGGTYWWHRPVTSLLEPGTRLGHLRPAVAQGTRQFHMPLDWGSPQLP